MNTVDYSTWSGLAHALAQVKDVRGRRGQRYEWAYLLLLTAAKGNVVVCHSPSGED